jgi:hypothetical protein
MLTKARHDKDVKGPRASCLPAPAPHDYTALAPHDCKAHATHVYTALAPQDFSAPAPYESTAPGPSPRAGPLMPRTRSSSLEIFTLSTGPDDMTSRPSRLKTTRPPRLMTARASRLRLGPAMPITRSSSSEQPGKSKNSKFLVPVDGSQQNSVRSSLAGTHRAFFRIYFQIPATPSSISQPFAPFGRFTHTPPMMYTLLHLHASSFR